MAAKAVVLIEPTELEGTIAWPGGYIFFRGAEGGSNFVFRVNEDGTGRQKVSPNPVLDFFSVSPDGEWFIALAPLQQGQ